MIDNNILIKGDNLLGLQWLLDNGYEGKIDLIYIDPPFATETLSVLIKQQSRNHQSFYGCHNSIF